MKTLKINKQYKHLEYKIIEFERNVKIISKRTSNLKLIVSIRILRCEL